MLYSVFILLCSSFLLQINLASEGGTAITLTESEKELATLYANIMAMPKPLQKEVFEYVGLNKFLEISANLPPSTESTCLNYTGKRIIELDGKIYNLPFGTKWLKKALDCKSIAHTSQINDQNAIALLEWSNSYMPGDNKGNLYVAFITLDQRADTIAEHSCIIPKANPLATALHPKKNELLVVCNPNDTDNSSEKKSPAYVTVLSLQANNASVEKKPQSGCTTFLKKIKKLLHTAPNQWIPNNSNLIKQSKIIDCIDRNGNEIVLKQICHLNNSGDVLNNHLILALDYNGQVWIIGASDRNKAHYHFFEQKKLNNILSIAANRTFPHYFAFTKQANNSSTDIYVASLLKNSYKKITTKPYALKATRFDGALIEFAYKTINQYGNNIYNVDTITI